MTSILSTKRNRRMVHLLGAASASVLMVTPWSAHAQTDPAPDQSAVQPPEAGSSAAAGEDEIVVTGFRASLNAALNLKRDSVSSVDAIVAEDIAQFPDQNLAESLQRIPGISIQRDGGEGRAITVRGLGPQFTRVRLNGMETVATTSDGASANRDRAFDFNVFASELFTSIVVHKTAEASLDEGSLGAVVDLNTGNPLGGRAGLNLALNAQGSYNDLSDNVGPRVSGVLSWRNAEGTVGFLVSAAYSKTDTLELGNNTVRWAQARFDSVNGTPCFTTQNSGGTYIPSAACDQAALAFHPRIPRYGEVRHDRERIGVTASFQVEPAEGTRVSIDGLFSRFEEFREEKWGEVLLRSNERSIDIVDFTVDSDNTMTSATLNDAWVRNEHFLRQSITTFWQIGARIDQEVGDTARINLIAGMSESDADYPIETTIVFDDRDAQNYQFDYTNSRFPRLTFGTDPTNPANFQLAEIRDRPANINNRFRTVQLNGEWDIFDRTTLKAGALYRRFRFDSEQFTRDTAVCGNGGLDRVLGTITCSPSGTFGPTAVYGFPAGNLGELFEMGPAGQPSGNSNSWLIPNLDASTAFTRLYERTAGVVAGTTRSVTESVHGGYLQVDTRFDVGTIEVAANAGVRWVRTDQSSTGLVSGTPATVTRNYDDWLPAVNIAVYAAENLIIRGAVARVMTRPTLGNLTPGGTADGFNFRITNGNPFLDPFRAWAYDLGVEWYFAPESVFSVALFRKEIASFPVGQSLTTSFDATGLPVSVLVPSSPAALNPELRAANIWTLNTTVNGEGATLNGVEFGLQGPFRFLPGWLSNFGGIANVTLVDSNADYNVRGPATTPGGALAPSTTRTSTLFGLSKRAFNGTLYYDDGRFSARVSASYRSRYIDAASGTGNVFEGYNSTINVDAAIRYEINDHFEVSLEGINLTDEYRDRFVDIDANRNYENNHFGRTILFGIRYRL